MTETDEFDLQLDIIYDRYPMLLRGDIRAREIMQMMASAHYIDRAADKARITELEAALEDIAGYATIETPQEVTDIINKALKQEEK